MQRVMLDGNGAAAEAMRLAKIQVVAAYPITPQSPIAEKLATYITTGKLDAKYIRVESEHTAMSATIGAQLTGVRAGTATSSVGLALMHEVLGIASGVRIPIVMPVVNRALVSPWSLWCDHQDTMAERDSGWMQLYAENSQEVIDLIFIAYHLAELPGVLTPAMVCLDGFFLSHTTEPVLLPDQDEVDAFLPPYAAENLRLDPNNPMFINNLVSPAEFTEMRYQQYQGMAAALEELPKIMEKFEKQFGRKYGLIEAYKTEGADAVIVCLGSMAGTTKYVVDQMRSQGKKVGMIKITSFRPFPAFTLTDALQNILSVGVLDRSLSLGAHIGPVAAEVRSALAGCGQARHVQSFVGGLGGRDITPATVTSAFDQLLSNTCTMETVWLDVKPNAMEIREVPSC